MNTYKVDITRTTYAMQTFEVEAISQEEAENLAVTEAANTEWDTGNAEYEVEYSEKTSK